MAGAGFSGRARNAARRQALSPAAPLRTAFLPAVLSAALLAGMGLIGLTIHASPAGADAASGIAVQGNQLYVNGQLFIPHGFNVTALLNSSWCDQASKAAGNYGPAELAAAMGTWNANTLRFQVSQPVLAGPDGAAYAQQIQGAVEMARSAGFIVDISMQDQSQACGPAEPLPSPETESAWATLITDTSLSSDPGIMFELFNEPQNSAVTTPATSPHQETWADWLSGGWLIEPTAAQAWQAYTPVGFQELVDYMRETLEVTNGTDS